MEFFWSRGFILCVILYKYTKFEPNPPILRKVMAIFPKPRWCSPPSCFSKNDSFSHVFYYMLSFCISVPNLMRIRQSTAQKLYFYEIQIGGRRHLEFWIGGIFGQVIQYMVLFCTYIQNLSQIHKSSAKLWLFLKSILFLRK